MLVISDHQFDQHERVQRFRARALALQWYRQRREHLPQPPDDAIGNLRDAAESTAMRLGIGLDEEQRLRSLTAFHALIPQPDERQWLIAADIVFDSADACHAAAEFARLAHPRP
jgi:hypothetical protein